MDNLRLLLLEDLDEEAKLVIDFLEDNNYEVIRVKNIVEAEAILKKRFFDIVVLDIMIDGKPEGISLANLLNRQKIDVPFLFLTSMQSKDVFDKAKSTNPYTYLLKPFNKLELLYALELALEKFHKQSNSLSLSDSGAIVSPSFLFIKKKQSITKVDVSSIIYIEVEEKYSSIFCEGGNYLVKLSLSKIKELLGGANFSQTHRNYLVNTQKIKEIYLDDNLIVLSNNFKVPFSERYKNLFLKNNSVFK